MTRSFYDKGLSRRDWLKFAGAGVVGFSVSGWLGALANQTVNNPQRKRACILLWMNGGPSQMDTFDLKPGHENGGPFKEIETSAKGLRISEHLPKLAKQGDRLAVIRSLKTQEGDHSRATFVMRTGYLPQGAIEYPTFGSLIAKELGDEKSDLPNFVSIAPLRLLNQAAFSPGFLGPQYAPLVIGEFNYANFFNNMPDGYENALKVQDLDLPGNISKEQADARLDLLNKLDAKFHAERPGFSTASHATAYEAAVRLMRSKASKAFALNEENAQTRDAYGRNMFGQGCLLARRLVEHGVPFVEVTLNNVPGSVVGWDTHQNNFESVKSLCNVLDPAWAALMSDLKDRGLIDTTTVVWMGEFGRTPKINPQNGRDHYPNAWSTVLCGGGVKGGQAYGKTSADGTTVEENRVGVADVLATICAAIGVDPTKQNMSNVTRPIRIVDKIGKPIKEVLA